MSGGNMVVRLLESNGKSMKIEFEGVPLAVANAIRRLIISEVPTMAVEEVLIIENSSGMTNEVLAHRISLIPFVSDIDRYVPPEECTCGSKLGCEKCVVRYVLKAEAGDQPITVYSRDMVPEDPNTTVIPVSGNIPIVKLAPGEKIELELYVRVGKGKKHAKWQPGIATLYESKESADKRILFVESFGFLEPKRMVLEAIKILNKKVSNLMHVIRECEQHA
ncbi:MAG: DNA-directed RNA polymerase subunit D [Thaumarchaeota archaeon]|jgi:DNA-directed RNA polymerase subunit D|nr:DNA-directed RNA polymerase subunit D [Candidatus Terraquivivens yellowstonensis]MCL7387416.1 DNA-directed RNA polymerase subunit D [Candidatus Terraquivivens yellowstonensis]MCL7392074.1 DNA-directed RNA polymerase subunit D [Candidatus Terraquivivens yellowstonensis]MCL7395036.1 DNA-directed RNA polymerase subunit D [Candidatus Terraquivivens yellowstonensis]MCL7398233.1 DNA-directed RNA polymerase subunit D [Candidatus Terraquivivens yellowstonensis]